MLCWQYKSTRYIYYFCKQLLFHDTVHSFKKNLEQNHNKTKFSDEVEEYCAMSLSYLLKLKKKIVTVSEEKKCKQCKLNSFSLLYVSVFASEYQRHHSQHKKALTAVSPPQVPLDYSASDSTAPSNISTINTVSSRDTNTAAYNSPTTVYLGGYNSSLPSLTPQQQQLLQEQLKRHSRYDEDFLATEV